MNGAEQDHQPVSQGIVVISAAIVVGGESLVQVIDSTLVKCEGCLDTHKASCDTQSKQSI